MTPYQYVDVYHGLKVEDPRLGLSTQLDITKYRSGWFPEDNAEATRVLDAVARKCCKLKKGNAELPATFTIPSDPRVDPAEEFYCAGIRRAFCSRGSPDEMRDALRLAVLGGITDAGGAKSYGEKWFGSDCNAFVGNYLGLSPMIGIPGYAKGYGQKGTIAGAGKDIYACRDLLPLPPRADPTEIASGDVIVTYGSLHPKHNWRWRHIALVEDIVVSDGGRAEGEAGVWDAQLRIAEWGDKGGVAKHKHRYDGKLLADVLRWKPGDYANWKTLLTALAKEMPGQTLVAFPGKDPEGQNALRFFLDASSLDYIWHRGLHIRNRFEGY